MLQQWLLYLLRVASILQPGVGTSVLKFYSNLDNTEFLRNIRFRLWCTKAHQIQAMKIIHYSIGYHSFLSRSFGSISKSIRQFLQYDMVPRSMILTAKSLASVLKLCRHIDHVFTLYLIFQF